MYIVKTTPYTYYISNVPYLYEQIEYHGASTDNKPNLQAKNLGSKFVCVNNGDEYTWDGTGWMLVNTAATSSSFETIVGLPAEMDTDWKTDIVGAVNELYEDSRPTHYNRAMVFEGDFYDATYAIPGVLGAALSNGSVSSSATSTKDHPGVISITDSTTANGGYKYLTEGSQFLLYGGERCEFVFNLGSGAARTTAITRLGFQDGATIDATVTDGVWLNIVGDGTKATISGKANDNTGVATTATTYTAEIDGTWYRGIIELNANASIASFAIKTCSNGLQVWGDTLNTKIPTGAGRHTGWGVIAGETTTDAGSVICRLDYANMSIDRTLVR